MTEPVPEAPESAEPDDGEERRRREPMFNLPGVVIAFIVACVGIHLVRLYVLDDEQAFWLLVQAAFIPLRGWVGSRGGCGLGCWLGLAADLDR